LSSKKDPALTRFLAGKIAVYAPDSATAESGKKKRNCGGSIQEKTASSVPDRVLAENLFAVAIITQLSFSYKIFSMASLTAR
jgi:hypothetical protein